MSTSYLLVYDAVVGDREKVKTALNSMATVSKWRYDLPSAFYIISQYTARQIADELRAATGGVGKFIVTEIPGNSYGWLTTESWYLVQNHDYKPK